MMVECRKNTHPMHHSSTVASNANNFSSADAQVSIEIQLKPKYFKER